MNKLFVISIMVFVSCSGAQARDHALSGPKSGAQSIEAKNSGINPALIWHKLAQIPSILEYKFLPQMQEVVQCVVEGTHFPTQLTMVNDVLDLEQQAQDHRAQILDLINRFGQIYQCDHERAQQLYTLIAQELSLLKTIQKQMKEIKLKYND